MSKLPVSQEKTTLYELSIDEMIKECCKRYDNICFVSEGTTLYGDIIRNMPTESVGISIWDRMIYGKVLSSFNTKAFILGRIMANSFMNYGEEYNAAGIVSDILSLQKLSKVKNKTIVLVQWDLFLDDLWRLFVQAYIEKYKLADKVLILKFNHVNCMVKTDFQYTEIEGSYAAFCEVVCKRKRASLQQFGITDATVDFFLDINSNASGVCSYLRNNLLCEKNLSLSYFNYLKDDKVNGFGLTESDFYKLLYDEMVKRGEIPLANRFAKTWKL